MLQEYISSSSAREINQHVYTAKKELMQTKNKHHPIPPILSPSSALRELGGTPVETWQTGCQQPPSVLPAMLLQMKVCHQKRKQEI